MSDVPVTPSALPRRRTYADGILLALLGAAVTGFTVLAAADAATLSAWHYTATHVAEAFKTALTSEFFLNPWFYVVFAAVLGLERLIPAVEQPLLSKGLRHDLWWVPFKLTIHATIVPLYVTLLGFVFHRWLGFLALHSLKEWPFIARLLFGLLVSDFLFWVSHYVRHKISAFWHFHAVHHSQRELNFMTEYRVHPVDDLLSWTIGFIPLFMVIDSYTTITAIIWLRHWHTRICHANLRTNFGILRYVIVTPQSHRVHHSSETRHLDRNFGLTFSIWDYLFGTQYRAYDEYPATGIDDATFPNEQTSNEPALRRLLRQLQYPFKAAARQ